MTLELKRGLAVSAAAFAVFGGSAGAALACHGPDTATATATQLSFTTFRHEAIWHGTGIGTAVTSYLGLQPAQIRADLAAGQTLAQIANATPGKSASGLVSAIMGSVKTKLDAAVTAGKLSTTTESTILGSLNTKVNAVVNAQWRGWWSSHHRYCGHI
jgi:hypothetical protein